MNQPQLDEPKTPEESKPTNQPQEQAQALLAELEKAGFKTAEEVAGALDASKQVGTMARHLGDSRRENESLRQELMLLRQAVENKNARPSVTPSDDGSLDLSGMIRKEVRGELREFYQKEIIEPQTRAQQQFHAEMEEVTGDEDYPLVADAFQKHLYSPRVQKRLISGETSVAKEYNKTIRAAMRAMLGKAAGSLKELTKKPDAPHLESGHPTEPNISTPGGSEKLTNIHAARQKGTISSDDALQAIVNQSLFGNPDGPK